MHIIGTGFAIEFTHRRTLLYLQAHTILVIDDEVDHRQAIDFRQIHRLMEPAAIGRTITQLTGNDLLRATIVNREGSSRRQGKLTTNDGIASHKTPLNIEEVH